MKLKEFLLANLWIRRPEYWLAEVPIVAVPVLLAAPGPRVFGGGFLWEGVALFFLLFHYGDIVNCLADRDRDAIYKTHLSRAVYTLGVRNVAAQTVGTALASLALAAHLAATSGRWTLLGLVVFGLFLGGAYSLPPVHFKSRGVGQLVCLWAVIFVVPMALAELFVSDRVSGGLLAVAVGYAALQMGAILVNTAEDYPEDLKFGIRTTIIALGLPRGIGLAAGLAAAGGACLLAALSWMARTRGLGVAGWAALAPLAASWLFVTVDLARLARQVASAPLEEGIARVKAMGRRVPVWVTLDAWATFAAAAVFFWLGGAGGRG
ncbi:MAG: UbiA family prenyltransferase [Planctomycetes bacterium]|nr:UbiA family prenyltransferase [Planctomycetota bacterium]